MKHPHSLPTDVSFLDKGLKSWGCCKGSWEIGESSAGKVYNLDVARSQGGELADQDEDGGEMNLIEALDGANSVGSLARQVQQMEGALVLVENAKHIPIQSLSPSIGEGVKAYHSQDQVLGLVQGEAGTSVP